MMFPFLVDHTAGIYLNESNAIVSHLWERYGDSVIGDHRSTFRLWYTNTENRRTVLLSTFFGQMLPGAASNLVVDYDMPRLLAASLLRPLPHMGTFVTPSKDIPENFLQLRLWGFEACPRSRLIREALSTLQLPYRMCTSGEGSPTRDELEHNNGSTVRLPVLEDRNAGLRWEGDEWCAAVQYLFETYATGPTLPLWSPIPNAPQKTTNEPKDNGNC